MKESIDIENLLEWAYRRQCVDRVAASRFSPRGPSGDANGAAVQMMMLGCRVDTSTHAEKVLGAVAPDDALVVHDTVLALGAFFLDDAAGVWDAQRAAAIGFTLARSRTGWWLRGPDGQGAPLTPVALPALVIIHAKAGTRPDWCEGWRNPGAAAARDAGDRDRWGRKRKALDVLSADDVAYRRAEYRLWHAALVLLAETLAGQLDQHEVKSPLADPEPWHREGRNAA